MAVKTSIEWQTATTYYSKGEGSKSNLIVFQPFYHCTATYTISVWQNALNSERRTRNLYTVQRQALKGDIFSDSYSTRSITLTQRDLPFLKVILSMKPNPPVSIKQTMRNKQKSTQVKAISDCTQVIIKQKMRPWPSDL